MNETKEAKCRFDRAWIGKCGKEADESGFCEEHREKKCCSCGAQATHDCPHTGQFVCGFLLCDNCEGATRSKDDPHYSDGVSVWGFLNHYHRPKQES